MIITVKGNSASSAVWDRNEGTVNILELFKALQTTEVKEEDLIMYRDMYFYPIKITATYNKDEISVNDTKYLLLHACKSVDGEFHLEINADTIEAYNKIFDKENSNSIINKSLNNEIVYFIPHFTPPNSGDNP